MTIALWIIQVSIDLFVIGGLVFLWIRRRTDESYEQKLLEIAQRCEVRTQDLERQESEMRQKMESQLTRLQKICSDASRLLLEKQTIAPQRVSRESEELTELAKQMQSNDIPTIRQIQKTRDRITKEIRVDLRTLLCDQLA